MRNRLIKKYAVMLVMWVYALSTFFQSFSFLDFNKVYAAENQLDYTNLVAVFVDNKLYNPLESDIKRYAQNYIQWKDSDNRYNAISNSKAIVLPVDIETITAPEVTKILENMYFDGISGEPSKLVWVVLIWEIPLPVVNQDGFIYPTVYPYVDFDEQKFIWDDDLKYFVYNDNPKWQPEIWHWLISFESVDEYKKYFNKLREYSLEPWEFIGKNIWYDDIIGNKKYFFDEGLGSYINNFLFAEDIWYRRQTNLMVKIMQWSHNEMLSGLLEWMSGADMLAATTESINIPTMTLETTIKDWYLKSYTSLIGSKHLDRTVKNVETANRRVEQYTGSNGDQKFRTSLDTHYLKIEQKDETLLRTEWWLDPLIIVFNNALESIVDEKIEEEKYRLNEIIPLTYLKYNGYEKSAVNFKGKVCTWQEYSAYENYFFGLNANYVTSMQETSSYRWTFRNFENLGELTIEDIQSSQVPSTDINSIDLNKKSIGWSYEIFATQVDSNRWYNINNTVKEYGIYDKNKIAKREFWNTKCEKKFLGICWRKRRREASIKKANLCEPGNVEKQWWCEMPQEFAIRNRWWASPINLSGMNDWLSGYNFQDAILPIYDIAGSNAIKNPEHEANSFAGVEKYSRLIQKTFVPNKPKFYTKNKEKLPPDIFGLWYNSSMWEDLKFTNRLPTGDMKDPSWEKIVPKTGNQVNFFNNFNINQTTWETDIIKIKKNNPTECVGYGTVYTYKTLDSRLKNNLSTETEIYWKTYKIFEDPQSQVKIFYEWVSDKIKKTQEEVDRVIDWFNTNAQWWVINNLNDIWNDVNKINNDLSSIIGYNLWNLSNLNNTTKQQLANDWKKSFTQQNFIDIKNKTESVKDQLLGIWWLADSISFVFLEDYIKDQFYNFQINNWNMIRLKSWQTNSLNKLTTTKNKFYSIAWFVNNAENIHENINKVDKNGLLSDALWAKKLAINLHIVNNSWVKMWCNSNNYGVLCDAIDTVRANLNNHRHDLNEEIISIKKFDFQDFDLDWSLLGSMFKINPFTSIKSKITSSDLNFSYQRIKSIINLIKTSTNNQLTWGIAWMSITTSNRPIDSPKYITFKWVWWDKVTMIYPNIYKAEVFTGNSNIIKLKNPEDIAKWIKNYLREVVKKYNKDLLAQKSKIWQLYNQNPQAYNLLGIGDVLATPKNINNTDRPYKLMTSEFLIEQLEKTLKNNAFFAQEMGWYDPIDFIAHMIYYQNIDWQERKVWNTIQEDIDNNISSFDINDKIIHVVDNYLVKDNDKWNFITPWYRNEWYEVAFINSDGNDYITAKVEPPFVQNIKSASSNYKKPVLPQIEKMQIEEDLQNQCNIPEAEWVLLFEMSNWEFTSPWLNALKCRWQQTLKKPFEFSFDRSSVQWLPFKLWQEWEGENFIAENLWIDKIQSQYINQLWYLDNDKSNQNILDNSNPWDYQKLEKITSYTKIEIENPNINADISSGIIKISSTVELGNVEFHIKNIGESKMFLKNENTWTNGNITEWKTGYSIGKTNFDPFSKKSLEFKIENPVAWTNVVVFYMCLPWTQDIENCVKKSLKLNIIPGKINKVEIKTPGNIVLQGSKMPISVIWVDKFGNNVWELFTDKFNISVSSWTLSYQSAVNNKITFSNFNKSDFVLNIDKQIKNGTEIRINIDGKIWWEQWTYASKIVIVRKWEVKIYKNESTINSLTVDLPSQNDYSYKDSFNITQMNLSTVPKITLKLQDNTWNPINIESIVNVSSKNWLLKPWLIEERSVTKTQNQMSFEIIQKRFAQKNNQKIKDGNLTIYLMPNFKAGEDIVSLSMPGIETIDIPVTVNPGPASTIEVNVDKDTMATNSSTEANLKISDNWWNIVKKNTNIEIGAITPLAISWINGVRTTISIKNGIYSFDIKSKEKGWAGFLYANIDWLNLNEQRPWYKTIMVQDKILPEKDLNIMYLNLFGNDWWNQRWFMSDNNKYVQKLISNSDKLLTTTTQLIDPDNIKNFPIIIGKKLKISNLDDNEIDLTFDEKMVLEVKDIWNIKIKINDFKIQAVNISEENVDKVITTLIANKYQNKNVLIYLPEDVDSLIESNEVKNNAIFINNKKVFDVNNKNQDTSLSIKISKDYVAGYQSWEMFLWNKNVWKLLIVVNNEWNINYDMESTNSKYDFSKVWINGSTNKEWLGFYEIDGSLPKKSMGYKSIQDSYDSTLGIWFTSDFKNITNFGAGKSVWESTISFASEFLINIWDPLLKRVNKNVTAKMLDNDLNIEVDSEFDKWIWEIIYSEPGKTIFKVKNLDFNNDGLEDIIVAFTDWTIKILKNYGWNQPFKQLWDLMVLSDWIKEIIVWDVDGNGYEDIVIWSKSDLLRVYKNNMWIFDVDWLPICINTNIKESLKSETPQNIWWVGQIFFEDMNGDKKLDIITNDKLWYIKIFYGGQTNGKDNYVSNDKNMCDDGRYQRQTSTDNTNMVYRFGIRVNENIKVVDKSLIRWKWINPEWDMKIDVKELWMDFSMFEEGNLNEDTMNEDTIKDMLQNATNFDMSNAEEQYKWAERYKNANFGRIPIYEAYTGENDVEYVEIWCLTWSDPVKIYKQYEDLNGDVLENWDKVQVKIIIKANKNFTGTFVDNIMWPWKISLTGSQDMIENFWFETGTISSDKVENQLKFHRDMANARYMIDNLSMRAGDEIKINYRLFYDWETQINNIELKDIDWKDYPKFGWNNWEKLNEHTKDGIIDIKIKIIDGCNKWMFVLFNKNSNNKKEYTHEYIDLSSLLTDFTNNNQWNFDNAMSSITNDLSNNKPGEDINFDNIPWLSSIIKPFNITDMLADSFNIDWIDLSNIANTPFQIVDWLLWNVMDKVDKLMWDLCKWFDLSEYGVWSNENCGLPIPFNQAFLWPGEYHLFGCFKEPLLPLTETLWKGLPVLTFPGNWPNPFAPWTYLPFPGVFGLPFKGINDWFLWVPWWTYDSQFRLYVVPTITAEIWIAICFGPHNIWMKIPDPLSSVGWNCIVTSVPLPCKDKDESWPNITNKMPEAFLDLEACNNQNIPCYVIPWESTSSLQLVSSSNASANMTTAVPDGSFAGWFINIEKTPVTEHGYRNSESGIEINGVKLKWWTNTKNRILWWEEKWLIKILAKWWLDKQIGYVLNNLTNFKIDVAWPDFDSMFAWLSKSSFKDAINEKKQEDCLEEKWTWDDVKKTCEISDEQKCLNKGMKREASKKTCKNKTNPDQNDDALSKLDNRSQNNLISRKQITNLSESSFANPFDQIEAMFEEVPLINIRTENITVKVPMISMEDITAYTNMSRNWITQQEKTLNEWADLFKSMIWWCGGRKDIKDMKDMKDALKELKNNLNAQAKESLKSIKDQIWTIEEQIKNANWNKKDELKKEKENLEANKDNINQAIKKIENEIKHIKNLNKKYNLNFLWNYDLLESTKWWEYYIRVEKKANIHGIIPEDIYLKYIPSEEKLEMFTKWFELVEKKKTIWKNEISYLRTNDDISNKWLSIKQYLSSSSSQCADLFLGGKFDATLNNFLNIQSNTTQLIGSVKQNIETLELYKKFPIDLYQWMHVWERYMSEISSLINNFLGTLSLWMKTNATRYSQYVDSLILIMTTIETYQAIIDLSVNWSERCSSCTNDNYDQFACKLWMICPEDLLQPIAIPPMKIPSIYLDFSDINLWTDIKLPKLNFVPTSVPLPKLPNIPKPPTIGASLDMEQALSMWVDMVSDILVKLEVLDVGISLPAMPIIPSPPDLPEIPSFIPSVKLELPLLPPAPKIPKIPNEIKAAIDIGETAWKILCIVKSKIWLVWEYSIKAKIEQMSQRTYEVPYWDNIDQTLSKRTEKAKTKIPERISDSFSFIKSNAFAEVELKWFDLAVESHVNLQYNFGWFYDFIDSVVNQVNNYSSMPWDWLQEQIDQWDERSRDLEARMSACTINPVSESCLWDLYTGDIKEIKEKVDLMTSEITWIWNNIKNWFNWVKEALQKIVEKENAKENLEEENIAIEENIVLIEEKIEDYSWDLLITTLDTRIKLLKDEIKKNKSLLKKYKEKLNTNKIQINKIQTEIDELYEKYGWAIESYEEYLQRYESMTEEYNRLKEKLASKMSDALDRINQTIWSGNDLLDDNVKFEKIDKRNAKIQKEMNEFQEKEEDRKEQRWENLNNLYKEISYVDYNKDTYQESSKIIKDTLNTILAKSDDISLNKKVEEYINLINIDKEIRPATNNINDLKTQYTSIIEWVKNNHEAIGEIIEQDYDKFLYAVSNNSKSLVSDIDTEISLSSKLFDLKKNTIDTIKQQENINKIYIDYNNKNVEWYLNALNNYSAKELNMSEEKHSANKEYLTNINNKTKIAYNLLDNKKLITQNNQNPWGWWNPNWSYVDVSSYINVIKTPEWSINLDNKQYVKNFQGKTLMVDLNKDKKNDLIMWDQNSVYVKYRWGNNMHENTKYNNKYYKYNIESYEKLLNNSEEWFIKINDIYLKLCDRNWEVKNFKYVWWDFDSIKVSRTNSQIIGDEPNWYLIKMIHRSDLFHDKEKIVSNSNKELFDKKYILALPKWWLLTWMRIGLEEWNYQIDDILSGLIFDVIYYNENQNKINITVEKIPRNWQYSEIYALELYKDELYMINSPSSNQIVAGPQVIWDTKWPVPIIELYRPSINSVIDTWERFEWYIGTNYTIRANREDNISIDKIWITDNDWNVKEEKEIKNKTWYIELKNLFFTWVNVLNYYFVGSDTNWNIESTQVTLNIKKPNIEIIDIQKHGNQIENMASPTSIIAEIDNDIDKGYVQFLRNRNGIWQTITGNLWWVETDKYNLSPLQTIITGWYYDFGNDIWLYLANWDLAVNVNPKNGKLKIVDWFENLVKIELDYSMKTPMIKVSENNWNILFWLSLSSEELIKISTDLDLKDLKWDVFGKFNGGKAVIKNGETLIYIGPKGNMYADGILYWDYSFNDSAQSVVYSFKDKINWSVLWTVEVKVKNLLWE